jgi:hypothetical protein
MRVSAAPQVPGHGGVIVAHPAIVALDRERTSRNDRLSSMPPAGDARRLAELLDARLCPLDGLRIHDPNDVTAPVGGDGRRADRLIGHVVGRRISPHKAGQGIGAGACPDRVYVRWCGQTAGEARDRDRIRFRRQSPEEAVEHGFVRLDRRVDPFSFRVQDRGVSIQDGRESIASLVDPQAGFAAKLGDLRLAALVDVLDVRLGLAQELASLGRSSFLRRLRVRAHALGQLRVDSSALLLSGSLHRSSQVGGQPGASP